MQGHYHLAGIAGVGMSALAEALVQLGCRVSGSDRFLDQGTDLPILGKIRRMGVMLMPQDGSAILPGLQGLVVSTAVEEDNPEVQAARRLGIPIVHRSVMLVRIAEGQRLLAIAGTAGKTTTTAMAGWLLCALGQDVSVVNGGPLVNWKSENTVGSARRGASSSWVMEMDESDKSLLNFSPDRAILTNISKDHYELDELRDMFAKFCRQVHGEVITTHAVASFLGADAGHLILPVPEAIRSGGFTSEGVNVSIRMPGVHNAWNAFFAARLALLEGHSMRDVARVFPDFLGVERRLELVGDAGGVKVYDDYAHNPAKISAAWETARPPAGGKMVGIWRPHGYGPLSVMMEDLAASFSELTGAGDILVLLPVFYAGGTARRDVTSEQLAEKIRTAGGRVELLQNHEEALEFVLGQLVPGDAALCLGARDPGLPLLARQIAARFLEKHPPRS